MLFVIRHLVATSLWVTWHLDSALDRSVGGGELAYLGSLLSAHLDSAFKGGFPGEVSLLPLACHCCPVPFVGACHPL